MNAIDQAASHIACGEHICQACDPHEGIHDNTAKPVQYPWQHCRVRTCSHARAPHDRPRGDDLTGRERDTRSIDRGDFGSQSCLDAKGRKRLAKYRACVITDRGSYDWIMIDEYYPVLAAKDVPKLGRHLGRNLDAGEARAHDYHG
jgi:hypothetical protein